MAAAPFDIGSLIEIDPDWHGGWPYIRGTRRTVATVASYAAVGLSPEELAGELSLDLMQVHAALCYYFGNRAEIDAAVERDVLAHDELARGAPTKRPVR